MIFATSDLHGFTAAQFRRLLDKAGFSDDDMLYVLGDVIDRHGLGGVDALRWIMGQANIELLLGNHEDMLLQCAFLFDEVTDASIGLLDEWQLRKLSVWLRNGAEPTLKALRQLRNEDPMLVADVLDFLRDAPLYAAVTAGGQDYLLLHGGLKDFQPGKKLSAYEPHDLLWHRPAWEESYFDDMTVILGHTPTVYYGTEYTGKMLRRPTWIDIDTSNRAPMLLRLDDLQPFYADEEYGDEGACEA